MTLLGFQIGVEQQIGDADDAVHGRPDFVAHGGEEIRFGVRCLFGGGNIAKACYVSVPDNRMSVNLEDHAVGPSAGQFKVFAARKERRNTLVLLVGAAITVITTLSGETNEVEPSCTRLHQLRRDSKQANGNFVSSDNTQLGIKNDQAAG